MSFEFNKIQSMKIIQFIVLTFILFTLSFSVGCSSKDISEYKYNYKGENTKWTAEYKGYSTVEFYKEKGILRSKENADGNLIVTYKGNLSELSSARVIDYEFKNGGGSLTFANAPDKKAFTWNHHITGAPNESENLKIIVNGNTEIIEMKSIR